MHPCLQNRKMPLTAEERKSISKSKKAEKYSAPPSSAGNNAKPRADSVSDAEGAESQPESDRPSSGGNLDDLRQRLQVLKSRIVSIIAI